MRKRVTIVALMAFVAGCAIRAEKPTAKGMALYPGKPPGEDWCLRAEKPMPKGMELYSWKPEGKDWCFSLIVGLNNRKPVLEIADVKDCAVVGIAAVKEQLSRLAKGEHVFWESLAKEPVPKPLEKDLRDYCNGIEVQLKPMWLQNKPDAANPAMTPEFYSGAQWRGVADPGC